MNSQGTTQTLVIFSSAMTAVVMIVLFAVGIVPLWLAAAVIVADGAFTWAITHVSRDGTES